MVATPVSFIYNVSGVDKLTVTPEIQLKNRYTIVIVTHNMQQAGRVSDRTAFFTLAGVGRPGQLIEYDDTQKIFSNPSDRRTEDYITGRFG